MGSQSAVEVRPEVSHGAKCEKCFHVNERGDYVNEQVSYANEQVDYANERDHYALKGSHHIISENRLFEYLFVHLLWFYALNLIPM